MIYANINTQAEFLKVMQVHKTFCAKDPARIAICCTYIEQIEGDKYRLTSIDGGTLLSTQHNIYINIDVGLFDHKKLSIDNTNLPYPHYKNVIPNAFSNPKDVRIWFNPELLVKIKKARKQLEAVTTLVPPQYNTAWGAACWGTMQDHCFYLAMPLRAEWSEERSL